MNIVFIKHPADRGIYLFEVPAGIALKAGENVMVKNSRGETYGVCDSDSFELDGSPLGTVAKICGAKFPLAPVIGRVSVERFEGESK